MAYFTLAEASKRQGVAAPIAEELNKQSAFLGLLPIKIEPSGVLKYNTRAALPGITLRGANQTVTQYYSVANRYEESMFIAESNPWMDKAVVFGDPAELLAEEAMAHVEKIRQLATDTCFYGSKEDSVNDVDGLNTRLLYSSGTGQVVTASGTGSDLMSVWVMRLAEDGVHGFAVSPEDLLQFSYQGERIHPTLNVMGYQAHVFLRMGLAVKNANAVAQVANIESSGSSNILTMAEMNDAISRVRNPNAIFCSRTALLQIQALFEGKATFGADEFGRQFTKYGDLPVYLEENLTIVETQKS